MEGGGQCDPTAITKGNIGVSAGVRVHNKVGANAYMSLCTCGHVPDQVSPHFM